jgi:hypothetical protein
MKRLYLLAMLLVGVAGCGEQATNPQLATGPAQSISDQVPGTLVPSTPRAADASTMDLDPVITESGRISVSIDGLGTNSPPKTIQVSKPAGATVRSAHLFTASTSGNPAIPNGSVTIDGAAVNWDQTIPGALGNVNHRANVTALVAAKINSAAAGLIDFSIGEANTFGTEAHVLAVIFNDPNIPASQNRTIALLFGAQATTGDEFAINLSDEIDKSDPNLLLDMSLGISYSFQPAGQFSIIDVNGQRLTSCSGGHDDGEPQDGALATAGGIGDTNANPDPNCTDATGPRVDDELYNLVPFVDNGDTQINLTTRNPSNNDNIFFGAFILSVSAGVNEFPPQADAGGPYTGTVGSPVHFDGTGSTDPDGDESALTYEWDFGDGDTGTGPSPMHTYDADGTYTVRLRVTDAQGLTDLDETTATITDGDGNPECGPFCFQPPTPGVVQHDPSGPFDGSKNVTLLICELNGSNCVPGPYKAGFLSTIGNNRIKVNAAEGYYWVKFKAKGFDFDPTKMHRIRVYWNGAERGHHDTLLPTSGDIEIRFRIESGGGDV